MKTNQYPKRRGRTSSYYPARKPGPSTVVEIVDYDQFYNTGEFERYRPRPRQETLVIDAEDKRPKCQPVGAQIDCR